MVEAGKEVFSLPITAKVMVPPVSLLTPLLDFGRCFIQHPYVQNVELQNNSELPVQYKMAPQDQAAAVSKVTFWWDLKSVCSLIVSTCSVHRLLSPTPPPILRALSSLSARSASHCRYGCVCVRRLSVCLSVFVFATCLSVCLCLCSPSVCLSVFVFTACLSVCLTWYVYCSGGGVGAR